MKILHVISGVGTGGAERFLSELTPHLKARGFDQEIVSLTGDGPMATVFEKHGFVVHKLDARGMFTATTVVRRLANLMDEFRPNVVQGWMYHGDLFATLGRQLSRWRKARLIWNIRCSDMTLDEYSLRLRMVVRACKLLSGAPDLIIANSEAGAKAHLDWGYTPNKLEVIHNGVDVEHFKPDAALGQRLRKELGIKPEAILIAHVARVDPMKDHATLLRAVDGLQGATTVLVGLGTEKLRLPTNVIALGRRTDVQTILAASDIVASSSAFGEGFSNAIAEGMSAGLLPIATRVGDAGHLVGDTGFICEPRAFHQLRAAFQRVIMMTTDQRAALGQAARQRIASMFTIKGAADRYEEAYRTVSGRDCSGRK